MAETDWSVANTKSSLCHKRRLCRYIFAKE